jgi:hypothetical protein
MAKKLSRAEKMRRFFAANPEMSTSQVAADVGVQYQIAYMAKRGMERRAEMERRRAKDNWKTVMVASSNESVVDKVSGLTDAQTSDMIMERIAEARRNRAVLSEEMLTGIDATLAERGTKYGKFADHAAVTYKLKNVLREHSRTHSKAFAYDQAEALDMICHKLGRIVNGDPDYADSWVDIAGYAKLVADRLETGKTV